MVVPHPSIGINVTGADLLEVQFARFDERLGNVEKGNDQLQQSINTLIQLQLNAAADDR